ncbi:MAG: C39 family peptidase [Cardiobacteriaceae bacterium]|nr:C39 family peptidase [Cardiobacteriaceae bacterium]
MKLSMLCWLCLSLSALAAPEDLPFAALDAPPVKSWKAMRDEGIVKQDLDYSCGAASIATLLNQHYGQDVTEEAVLALLQADANKAGMASFADMQRILPSLGFRAEGYALSFAQLTQLQVPVIVYLRYRKNDHFSVLRGIDGDTVLLADPSLGHVSMSRTQFLDAWHTRDAALQGKILAIVPEDTAITHNGSFFTRSPERQTRQSMVFARFPERY